MRKNTLETRKLLFDQMPGSMLDKRHKRCDSTKGADHNPGNSCYRRPGSQKK